MRRRRCPGTVGGSAAIKTLLLSLMLCMIPPVVAGGQIALL